MNSSWNEQEYLDIVAQCGYVISSEDVAALSKRKLLSPWGKEIHSFGHAHIFLLAMYFDAITVYRHPWSVQNSDTSLQDVKRLNNEVLLLDPNLEPDLALRQKFIDLCEDFLVKHNPFGPLADLVLRLNEKAIGEVKNTGRLCVEINHFLSSLSPSSGSIVSFPQTKELFPSDLSEASDISSVETGDLEVDESQEEIPVLASSFDENDDTEESHTIVEEKTAGSPLVVGGPDGMDGDKTIPISGAFHDQSDVSAEVVLTDRVEEDVDSAPLSLEEVSSEGIEAPSEKEDNPFRRTEKTQALVNKLKSMKNEPPDDIREQIQALNEKRQKLISAQDWSGLADLYESKIDLFSVPEERQEVLLTLATLNEIKIKNPSRALTFFQLSIENGSIGGLRKSYEGLQRVGYRPDIKARTSSWLQTRMNEDISVEEMPILQLSNSNFLKECGKSHQAFLSYAAFLVRDPSANVNETSLSNLESYAKEMEDSELESFYTDLLDFDEGDSSTRTLIAKRAGLFNQGRNPMLAIKYLRMSLENNPSEEESYRAISHIYQEEENWPDLIQLASKRYAYLEGEERSTAAAQLEQFISEDVMDPQSIERYSEWAREEPNSWAVEGLIRAFEQNGRSSEGYAFLQTLNTTISDPRKKEKVYLSLARTALKQFESPEDALTHFQAGLALAEDGQKGLGQVNLLSGLAAMHIEAGQWEFAINALEELTGNSILSDENRLAWLAKGVQIAEQACIESKLTLFRARIAKIETQS